MASYQPTRAIARYFAVLTVVAGLDLLSKGLATMTLAGGPVPIAGPMEFALVHNRGSAFGVSLGAYTFHLNAIATIIALGLTTLVVRGLSTVDPRAPIALGLIAGAAIGNLTSLLVPPAGVADFLAIEVSEGSRLVLNMADVAAYAGLAMTARSVMMLARAISAERARRVRHVPEIEVPIPLAVEGVRDVIPALARRDRSAPVRGDRPKPVEPQPNG